MSMEKCKECGEYKFEWNTTIKAFSEVFKIACLKQAEQDVRICSPEMKILKELKDWFLEINPEPPKEVEDE